jgi:methylmalonyl-CoA mutase N-terminal domain/subunit
VRALRARRDGAAVDRALAAVRAAMRDPAANVMPPILDAVRAYATLGEICDIFRAELGEHRDPAYL